MIILGADRHGGYVGRLKRLALLRRKPDRLAARTIELGPVEVEMLKVLLRDIAQRGRVGLSTGEPSQRSQP